jgi:hypothetical protein
VNNLHIVNSLPCALKFLKMSSRSLRANTFQCSQEDLNKEHVMIRKMVVEG